MGSNGGGKDWKKGQSGNPKGRPPIPPDLKEARKFNALEVERVLDKFMGLSRVQLKSRLKESGTPMLERMIGQIMLKATEFGDHSRLDFLLTRLIGKVKDQVEHSGKLTLEDLISGSREGEKS